MNVRILAFSAASAVFGAGLFAPSASAGALPQVETQRDARISAPAIRHLPTAAVVSAQPAAAAHAGAKWTPEIRSRLAALGNANTAAATALPSGEPSNLRTKLDALASGFGGNAEVGVSVKDLRTGQTVYARDANAPMNPASNHKLLTATAAVALLGADFRFETRVYRDGATLYVKAGGDPSLQVEDLQTFAAQVKAENPSAEPIDHIVVDSSMFSSRRFGPGYDRQGPGFSYMAPSGALSLQYNTVVISVSPGVAGGPVRVDVDPPSAHIDVQQTATTGRGRLSVETHGQAGRTVVAVDGRLPAGAAPVRIRRRVDDPNRFAAATLASALSPGRAVDVALGTVPPGADLIYTHRSAPLTQVLGSALKFSNNFTTEQVLRTLGHVATGAPGDWANGAAVLRAFWSATGQDPAALAFENASGLSATGYITPAALVDLLTLWTRDTDAAKVLAALPVAGREGTLRGRLRRSRGRVRAKTGTLATASGLTGIVSDRHGMPRYAFSVLVNGEDGVRGARRLQDRMVMALVHAPG